MFNQSQGALGGLLSQGNIPENTDLGAISDVCEYTTIIILAFFLLGCYYVKTIRTREIYNLIRYRRFVQSVIQNNRYEPKQALFT